MKGNRDILVYKGYRVGMRITITGIPSSWSSYCNDNYPMYVKFPYYCSIKKIGLHNGSTSMTCGFYGWSLDTLIDEKLIISEKELRKQKLRKIEYGSKI